MDSENVSRATFHKIRLNLFPIQLGNTKLGHTSTHGHGGFRKLLK